MDKVYIAALDKEFDIEQAESALKELKTSLQSHRVNLSVPGPLYVKAKRYNLKMSKLLQQALEDELDRIKK